MCEVLAQQNEFSTTLRSCLVVCKVRNELKCFEFLQFFQVSLAASTNWRLKPGGGVLWGKKDRDRRKS